MDICSGFFYEILGKLDEGVYFVDADRKITYWNNGAETITGYRGEDVIGSRCCDNILVHVDQQGENLCSGNCPLAKSIIDGTSREGEVFLHHKDGHRIPVRVRITPFRNKDGKITGAIEIFSQISEKNVSMEIIEDLKKQVFVDPLTEIPNRRFLEANILARLNELARYDWPFALIFIDIDHFKRINDNFGHNAGDETLRMVSKSLLHCSRSFDTVGRWGGEEFLAVIINVDEERLYNIAERYRVIIENSRLDIGESPINVSVSLGATLARKGDNLESLVRRADSLMYASKAAGRNCTSMDGDAPVQPSLLDNSLSLS
ncbi:MAG TPA: sensor domain-containing diguanylate cyclase [Geobacteraceae bacterium]|nr:sensor domain-containing diguanylate cyclase [Geobacteraceae bacterium]